MLFRSQYTDNGTAAKLDYALDWGWFRLVEKPIFYYLDLLFHLVGNFGVAIILLTLTITRGIGYWGIDQFNRDVLVVTALLFPSMAIGIFIGNRFHHGMSETVFRRTVSGALIASGLALLAK